MNGRELLKKYSKMIMIITKISLLIPQSLFNFLYNLTSNSEGKIALFIRYIFVKKYSKRCGENIYIGSNVRLKNIHNLVLGNNISIHALSYIDCAGGVNIGDNVSIANMSSIISFDHTWEDKTKPIKYNKVKYKKICIKDDVWIGANVKVLGDVIIESRSIVAAGAVVNKNVDHNTIVAGVPAKIIKNI